MYGHFCFCHLTGNIVIAVTAAQKFTNPICTVIFARHLIGNNDVSVMHKFTDLIYIHMSICNNPHSRP